jgi:aminopeptidase C
MTERLKFPSFYFIKGILVTEDQDMEVKLHAFLTQVPHEDCGHPTDQNGGNISWNELER